MAEVVVDTGIDPDDPDVVVLAVVIDQEASVGERAVMALGDLGYPDVDGVYRLTDVFADRRLVDGEVTVDIVSHPDVLKDAGVSGEFPAYGADLVLLLRVVGETDHDTLPAVTHVFTTPLAALTDDEDERPFVLGPPPGQRSVAENVLP